MIHFVGAGPGAADLITIRGAEYLKQADCIIYAGSLVNPELLDYAKAGCEIYNSAKMILEEVIEVMKNNEADNKMTVRLHTGDMCLYGAIREQMDILDTYDIEYDYIPGVSSFSGAASALCAEYTLPGVSQSVVITRQAGRTPVPSRESISSFAQHGATMVIFLSSGLMDKVQEELIAGGYDPETPAAIVYKATWPDEKKVSCTVGTIAETGRKENISNLALILVGNFLGDNYERSKLYHPGFTTAFREGDGTADGE